MQIFRNLYIDYSIFWFIIFIFQFWEKVTQGKALLILVFRKKINTIFMPIHLYFNPTSYEQFPKQGPANR